jgi:hypothetical protein
VPIPPRSRPDRLANLRHLTSRDRLLMSWLAEHQTLTTAQIATALFPSLRAAQKRLTLLHRIGALDRFAFARTPGDTGGLRYTLGPLGDLLHPRGGGRRSLLARRVEIARNPKLDHLVGVNGFFTDLYGHARTHPDTRLARWWGETYATGVYSLAGIHPDGHGIWQADGRTVGFFVEHDRSTEALRLLLAKLPAYQRLAVAGPRYPVLFHLPTVERETNLHQRLADLPLTVPVATATHGRDPAARIWALAGDGGARLRLHELPSDPGPAGISNPQRFGH